MDRPVALSLGEWYSTRCHASPCFCSSTPATASLDALVASLKSYLEMEYMSIVLLCLFAEEEVIPTDLVKNR